MKHLFKLKVALMIILTKCISCSQNFVYVDLQFHPGYYWNMEVMCYIPNHIFSYIVMLRGTRSHASTQRRSWQPDSVHSRYLGVLFLQITSDIHLKLTRKYKVRVSFVTLKSDPCFTFKVVMLSTITCYIVPIYMYIYTYIYIYIASL